MSKEEWKKLAYLAGALALGFGSGSITTDRLYSSKIKGLRSTISQQSKQCEVEKQTMKNQLLKKVKNQKNSLKGKALQDFIRRTWK